MAKVLSEKPQFVMKGGKPTAVILDIRDYKELLERLEDVEDLAELKELRKKHLSLNPLRSF